MCRGGGGEGLAPAGRRRKGRHGAGSAGGGRGSGRSVSLLLQRLWQLVLRLLLVVLVRLPACGLGPACRGLPVLLRRLALAAARRRGCILVVILAIVLVVSLHHEHRDAV